MLYFCAIALLVMHGDFKTALTIMLY